MEKNPSELLKTYASESTIHGIRYLFDNDKSYLVKFFWIISLIFSIFGLSFCIFIGYQKWNVNPDIITSTDMIPSFEIPFPAVTICNPVMSKNKYANFNEFREKLIYDETKSILEYFDSLSDDEFMRIMSIAKVCEPLLPNLYINNQIYDDDINNTDGYVLVNSKLIEISKMEQNETIRILKEISLMTKEYHLKHFMLDLESAKEELTEEYRLYPTLTQFGMCSTFNMLSPNLILNEETLSSDFTINVGKDDKSSWTIENGFGDDDFFPIPIYKVEHFNFKFILKHNNLDVNNMCSSLRNSYRVAFHLPNEIPTIFTEKMLCNMGNSHKIIMTAKKFISDDSLLKYPPLTRRCYKEGERTLKFFKTYTKKHCDIECYTDFVLKTCKCVTFWMPRENDTLICDAIDICPEYKLNIFVMENSKNLNGTKFCNCLPSCADIKYSIKSSTLSEFNSLTDRDLRKRMKENNNQETYTSIEILFEDLQIEVVRSFVTYGFQNFIADCGGLIGLFLGCSLISFIEIIYYLIVMLLAKRKMKLERN